jgi:hypothetical protein
MEAARETGFADSPLFGRTREGFEKISSFRKCGKESNERRIIEDLQGELGGILR